MATLSSKRGMPNGAGSASVQGNGAQERPAQELTRALGWISLGLGVAQLVAPREVTRLVGLEADRKNRALMRMIGAREMLSGIGALAQPRPAPWLWARVGGDLMDVTLLASGLGSNANHQGRLTTSLAAVIGIMAADLTAAMEQSSVAGTPRGVRPEDGTIPVERVITVWKQPDEVFAFWRNLENLPRFMNHLQSVRDLGNGRSHWVANGPAGRAVEWDAQIIEERANEVIAWRTLDDADVWSTGVVTFAPTPDGAGTEVTVDLRYAPPAGVVGMTVARLFGEEPSQQLREDLRRFKQVMELGEVVLSDAIATRGARAKQHPARPLSETPPQVELAAPFNDSAEQSGASASL